MERFMSVRQALDSWAPLNNDQKLLKEGYLQLLQDFGEHSLERNDRAEHITASCFVFSPDFEQVLLCFHGKGKFWVQLGGHFEPGDDSIEAAALREGREESGLHDLKLFRPEPGDVDMHPLSTSFGSCRAHFDIGMVATADPSAELLISSESNDLQWWPIDSLPSETAPGVKRRIKNVLHEICAPVAELDLKRFPKISLHDHLDGGLRPGTLLELAETIGHELPAADPVRLAEWFRESANSGSLPCYLQTFVHTVAVMQTKEALFRVAKEYVQDLADDGVVYGEVRWAPELHGQNGLTLDEVVEVVRAGLEAGVNSVAESGRHIRVNQLLTAMRHMDQGQEIAELALRHRNKGVVGFDIAGPEEGYSPARFREAFTYLAQNNFPTTVHAGEAAGLKSIQSALVDGRALRLGHGVRIAEDLAVDIPTGEDQGYGGDARLLHIGHLASWVRDRGIALEVCPSSNQQTGAFAAFGAGIESHPIDVLYQNGFNVTVSTDNRLMSGVTLTDEFRLLSDTFGYGSDEVLELTLNAANSSFLPLEEKASLIEYIRASYAAMRE